jgi:hypothetical protein
MVLLPLIPISFFGGRRTSVRSTRVHFFHCYKDQRMKDEQNIILRRMYYTSTEGL